MASEWIDCSVGDIAAPAKNALVGGPFGSNLVSNDYVASGVPVIRGQNMGFGRWVGGEFVFVSQEKAVELAANVARSGDIVFTQRGTLGQVAIVPSMPFDAYVISQSQMKLSVNREMADALFIYYVFRSEDHQLYLLSNAIQTGVPHTNLSILRNTPLRLPPLPEQRAIAAILGSLDDKIELNQRMNITLEATARALFKSWFVDFDPVRAKMEGRQPEGMDADTAALFPDRLVDSELGPIPEGWRVGQVGDAFDLTMGQSPPGETYNESGDGLPFYQGNRDFGFRYPSKRVYCTQPTRIAEAGDTLVSVRAPVGAINMAMERCCIGRGVAAIRHKLGYRSYTYYAIGALSAHFENFEGEGTVFGSISGRDFRAIRQQIPPRHVLRAFEQFVSPLDQRIETSSTEAESLAATRDALLPKLLSGEVRVNTAKFT